MDSLEIVNSHAHQLLRMRSAGWKAGHFARIVVSEIAAAAAACPLLFAKDAESGAFYIGAMLGFRPGESLMDRPDGHYAFRPLEADREGIFAVGEHIALDRGHARFSDAEGEPLFDPDGTRLRS